MKNRINHEARRASAAAVLLTALATCLLSAATASAQEFFNLTAAQVKIDSVLPSFLYERELGYRYADSSYAVAVEYPEFIDMTASDVARLRKIAERRAGGRTLPADGNWAQMPELPEMKHYVGVSRKQGTLYGQMVPIVYRDGRYQKLVSFKLSVKAEANPAAAARAASGSATRSGATGSRYADHSVLATGNWAKIRVPASGVYELTDEVARQAGFSSAAKVRIFGYGGALQPERLTPDYLEKTDDLKEVPTCTVGGHKLFYAVGPVTWANTAIYARTRNPYSDYGYYFLTDGDEPLTIDETAFIDSFYPSNDDYHSLHEVDNYAWFQGGRNLYEKTTMNNIITPTYTLKSTSHQGTLSIQMSYDTYCTAQVTVNDSVVGMIEVSSATAQMGKSKTVDKYSKAAVFEWRYTLNNLNIGDNTVKIKQKSGSSMRLDYMSLTFATPFDKPDLQGGQFPAPEYVYNITNQDHHADTAVDMVIIIPTTQKLLAQAEQLKAFHEERDSLRVRIVPADELFNEFSSGTPDANAYRRYLKMLYDRAETDEDMPRFLLLFGDGAWDNRMLTNTWRNYSPDDFLLCYESENSFSETDCYVSDDYFCLMDDNEGGDLVSSDKGDVAVGRLPARTAEEAQILVDKAIGYMRNDHAGAWQNTLCFMGDDGNNNMHMDDAEHVVALIQRKYPAYNIKKIYWDAYTRTTSSTGFSYPDVTNLIKKQMQNGALIMNYTGHGAPYTMSHEMVSKLEDFAEPTSLRLPLWLTASCDIMPFDGQVENIGETAMFNKQGGAICFYGTTRTVYSNFNRYMNLAFTNYVLAKDSKGRRYTVGEAARLAKNRLLTPSDNEDNISSDFTTNKLQYTLLGDPALTLATPTLDIVVDEINGQPVSDAKRIQLGAGLTATVKGHIVDAPDFNGTVTITVRDVEQTIVCKMNNAAETDEAFTFKDRPNTLYSGNDSVRNGSFTITFAVPKDISYSSEAGQMTLYAVSNGNQLEAHGENYDFELGSGELPEDDEIGPSIYCYLNAPSFTNGGDVNTTPYFYAELEDKDGINASGNGVGHDLELIIDGEMMRTYTLNDYFQYDFGDYKRGTVGFSIPELDEGQHKLLFRAWDVLNNSSTAELAFNVVKGLEPDMSIVSATKNPASSATTFIINHNRPGAQLDIELDIYDASGRLLWKHNESGVATGNTYTMDWNLTVDGGRRLQTGVYLYRVLLSCDGSHQASQAKKIIVLRK